MKQTTGLRTRFGARDYDRNLGPVDEHKDPIRFGGGQANIYEYYTNDEPVNNAGFQSGLDYRLEIACSDCDDDLLHICR